MITYDPGSWSICFAFRVHGSAFLKSLPFAIPAGIISALARFMMNELEFEFEMSSIGTNILGGFTFTLGFLVVFRAQQAYYRWWEGGTLLQELRGEWFNAFSSLLAFCNSQHDKKEAVLEFQHTLVRLMSLLYCVALEQVTTVDNQTFEIIELDGFEVDRLEFMQTGHDRCEIVLQWVQRLIYNADEANTIKVAPPILSRVYNQLGNGIVNLNNARKITDFPIPFPLAQMVTLMLLMQFGLTVIICATSVKHALWSGFLSFIVVFSFWSINYIAVELEQPFGDDANDLPLQEMQQDFIMSLKALLNPKALIPPKFYLTEEHKELRSSYAEINLVGSLDMSGHRRKASFNLVSPGKCVLQCRVRNLRYEGGKGPSTIEPSRPPEPSSVESMLDQVEVEAVPAQATPPAPEPVGQPEPPPLAQPEPEPFLKLKQEILDQQKEAGVGKTLDDEDPQKSPQVFGTVLKDAASPDPHTPPSLGERQVLHQERVFGGHGGVEDIGSLMYALNASEPPWLDKLLQEHLAVQKESLGIAREMKDVLERLVSTTSSLEDKADGIIGRPMGKVHALCCVPPLTPVRRA